MPRIRPNARRVGTIAIASAGQLVLIASIAAPLIVIVVDALRAEQGRAIDPTLLHVLPRTIGIATTSAAMATLLAIPASIVLGSPGRRGALSAVATGLVLLPLLTPSHVHVYWWQLMRTAFSEPGVPGPIGSVVTGWFGIAWVTACWLWPIPALLMAAGWRREGGAVFEVALLDAPAWRARLIAARASLLPYAATAGAIVFVFSCVEYSLPNLANLPTYSTELFLMSEERRALPASLVWQSWPLLLPAAAFVVGVCWLAARTRREAVNETTSGARHGVWPVLATLAVLALTYAFPLGYGVSMLSSLSAISTSFQVFGPEWVSSLTLAGVVCVMVFVAALSVSALRANGIARLGWLAAALLAAAAPAALIGVTMITLFDSVAALRSVYDETPAVWWLASVTRVAFVGLLAAAVGGGAAVAGAEELARADGLSRWEQVWYVRWPMRWPTLLAAAVAAGLISMSEVAVSTLVRPPGVGVIAVSLLNQMHFGRQDAVIASCLLTLIPAAAAAGLMTIVLWARRGDA